ncbi:hypothetical protein ACQKJG_23225 [Priestia megaterium]|uniref:hypothetical protein n=1 Tax=Priestia TaxID=2800373 RepID=UPI001C8E0574|nr:hypothetical protein [Priestia aryabhattai]MBY0029885.1 hypothetical protein [Priestia aryabhattai]
MHSIKVNKYFTDNNFFERKFFQSKLFTNKDGIKERSQVDILPFDKVFISAEEKEIYIIEEKNSLFTKEEIDKMDEKILTFIQFLSNRDPIKYNINLLLLCPFPTEKNTKEINMILGYERSKYTCRKIFLDTSNVEFQKELSILPSFPLEINLTLSDTKISSLSTRVKNIIDEDLYNELLKEEDQIELDDILNLVNVKGDNTHE